MATQYIVQAYRSGHRGYLIADEPREVPNEGQARLWAERLAAARAGVVAFSRTNDPGCGDWEARVICEFGRLPDTSFGLTT